MNTYALRLEKLLYQKDVEATIVRLCAELAKELEDIPIRNLKECLLLIGLKFLESEDSNLINISTSQGKNERRFQPGSIEQVAEAVLGSEKVGAAVHLYVFYTGGPINIHIEPIAAVRS